MVFAAALSLSPWPCLGGSRACCEAVAAGLWLVCAALLSGFRRCRYRASLFGPFSVALHAVPLRLGPAGGRPGWLRPGRALAALVLAAGLWLRGLEGTVRHPASRNFRLFFRSLFARRATALGRALAALVLAAGLWLRGPGESS